MSRFVLICFLLFYLATGYTQPATDYAKHVDSLKSVFNKETNDSIKARLAYEISYESSFVDSITSKSFLTKARQLGNSNKFLSSLYLFYLANYLYDLDPDASMKIYLQADKKLSIYKTKEAYYFRARCWRNFATLQQRKDDENGMLTSITRNAIPLAQKSGNKELEGELYALIGLVFMNQHMYTKAVEQFKKGLTLVKSSNPLSPRLADIYDHMTRTYCFADSFPQAKQFLDEHRDFLKGKPESSYTLSLYDNESIYFRKVKNYPLALQSVDKGISLATKLKDPLKISSLQFNKYKLYFEMGKYNEAKNILRIVMAGPGSAFTENKIMYYHAMSETYAGLNDMPNAYKWLKEFNVLWDSAYVEKMRTNIVDIEAKYQKSEKEKEILNLQNQRALEKQKGKTNTLIYLSVICLLLSSVIITYLQLRNKKRKEQLLQNEIKNMENERKLSTYEALIDGQEKERNRLATELHDGLGGMLAAVKMNLSNTAKDVASVQEIIKSSTIKLDHSINELRLIARNLMPPSLRKLGLVSALQDFCDGLKSENLNIVFQPYDVKEAQIDENTRLIIYRIFQELITNAIKHSGGTEILADLVQFGRQIQITVEDNGVGFNTKSQSKGIGLANIRSRVEFLKGSINIESNNQLGTTINITFNMENAV